MLFILLIGGVGVWDLSRRKKHMALIAGGILVLMFMTTVPWQIRNYTLGGRLQLSPPIWAFLNVNYLSAITTVETGAEFSRERRNQKVLETTLLQRDEYSQIYAKEDINILRHHVLSELWNHRATVLKLEGMILFSYFTNDNYYNQLIRMGFVDPVPNRVSPTQIILREGLSGVPRILEEMKKQYYVPILSRLYQFSILLFAAIALFRLPRRFAFLLILLIGFSALSTTVTTFGVEIRYRMPMMPILFLLVGYTIATGLPFLRKKKV
jgi:hypothetical protein